MKKIYPCFLFASLFFLNNLIVHGQSSFGRQYFTGTSLHYQSLLTTSDNNLLLVGDYTSGDISPNVSIINKANLNGDILWSKSFTGDIQQNTLQATEDADGNYVLLSAEIIIDLVTFEATYKTFVTKISTAGELLWSKYLDYGSSLSPGTLVALKDGSIIVTATSTEAINSQCYMAKLSSNGNIIWSNTFDNKGYRRWIIKMFETAGGVVAVSQGSIGQGGVTEQNAAIISLLNPNDGNVSKARQVRLNGSQTHFVQAAGATKDGGFVVGATSGQVGDFAIWIFKVDADFNLKWSTLVENALDDRPACIIEDAAGNIKIGGMSNTATETLPYLITLNANGTMMSASIINNNTGRSIYSVAEKSDSLYISLNDGFTFSGIPYPVIYRFAQNDSTCAGFTGSGTWASVSDGIFQNKQVPVSAASTVVNNTAFTLFDLPVDVNSLCEVLSATIISFTAERAATGNILKWIASAETNVSSYQVQRSTDGIHFTETGQVNALHSTGNNLYSFTDKTAASASVYYRLKINDYDGKTSFSTVKYLPMAKVLVSAYPNPVRNVLTVKLTALASSPVQLFLYNVAGKTIIQKTVEVDANGTATLNMAAVAKGEYFLTICVNGKIQTTKIVKQ